MLLGPGQRNLAIRVLVMVRNPGERRTVVHAPAVAPFGELQEHVGANPTYLVTIWAQNERTNGALARHPKVICPDAYKTSRPTARRPDWRPTPSHALFRFWQTPDDAEAAEADCGLFAPPNGHAFTGERKTQLVPTPATHVRSPRSHANASFRGPQHRRVRGTCLLLVAFRNAGRRERRPFPPMACVAPYGSILGRELV